MSYLVFARKWRPKNFDEVVGQDHITKTLKSAIRSGKLAHAYLFCGPQGVGKTSCARILAKALNCQKGPTENPCGVCPACLEIADGRSLDIIEIDGASNRGIDEIRSLRENVKFAPLSGQFKVYIIDEVHMLTPEAFNALLKTLEEPPAFVKFIFATTQVQKVLPTILSRCQRFDFVRIPNLKVIEKLKEIARDEKLSIGDDVFFAIAKAADGCLRDAESILDQMIAFSQNHIKLADVIAVLGIIEEDAFLRFVDACVSRDTTGALKLIGDISAQGKNMNVFLDGLLEHYRNLMVLKIVKEQRETLVDLPRELIEEIASQAQRMELASIMIAINQIFAAQEMARKLNTTRIPLEILAVKLSASPAKKTTGPAESDAKPQEGGGFDPHKAPQPPLKTTFSILKDERGSVDNSLSSFGAAAPAPAPPASDAARGSCTLKDVSGNWERFIGHLSGVKMSLATYLRQATVLCCENGCVTLGFPKSAVFFKETLEHKDNLKVAEETLSSICACRLRVKLEIVADGVITDAGSEDEVFEETPFLKSALDLFKGKVIKK